MKRKIRDPYLTWKLLNILLGLAVIVMAFLQIAGIPTVDLINPVIILGAVMMSSFAIMGLVKGRRIWGYTGAAVAGVLIVLVVVRLVLFR